jgi:hypothetical protein
MVANADLAGPGLAYRTVLDLQRLGPAMRLDHHGLRHLAALPHCSEEGYRMRRAG